MTITIPRPGPGPGTGMDETLSPRLIYAHVNRHDTRPGGAPGTDMRLDHALLTFIAEGDNRIRGDGWDAKLASGDAMLIRPSEEFTARFGTRKTLVAINVHFDVPKRERARLARAFVREVRAGEDTTGLRRAMESCAVAHERGDDALADAELASSLLELAKIALRRAGARLSRHVSKALSVVRNGAEERLTRTHVARAIGLSPSYLSEIVTRETGVTLSEHIRRSKVERARELMRTTSLNFSQIAERLGMDLYTFSRLFKKITGASPSAYCKAADFGRGRPVSR